jgi:hypothetical protein
LGLLPFPLVIEALNDLLKKHARQPVVQNFLLE